MNRRRLAVLAFSALLVLGAVLFGRPHHPHFWWERVPGVWALIGFAGCWLLVLFSKALAKQLLERDEDYYGD